MSLKIYF